ncbi:AzlC family ABC transporter permease [Acrocarpospora macrocephala]|uniref:Branched-chain amino acid ABC transporter permease n=1 Tax=Acrocarpospora macrocephala TaxID=150177 RepID=A0A5M3WNC5_9ACTN|nr:AzlC family ABC transporter permease [Acrocarpospora macrocephala]GES10797.1 branched-chain amino acid ABC transporter permease [Acrocarpospora macrocephala]
MHDTERQQRRAAIRDGLGVGVAVGVSGVAFGAAAITAGLTVAQACALSLFAFTGASQFALAGVVGAGGGLVAGAAGALLLGARNSFYGLRLAVILGGTRGPLRTLVTAQGVIDESSAVAFAQPTPAAARAGFYTTFGTIYLTWNLTTLLGALGASQVSDPAVFGLDAVGPATFLALLWPRLRGDVNTPKEETVQLRLIAAGGAAIALLATPFTAPGVPVLLAAVAALIVMLTPGTPERAAAE